MEDKLASEPLAPDVDASLGRRETVPVRVLLVADGEDAALRAALARDGALPHVPERAEGDAALDALAQGRCDVCLVAAPDPPRPALDFLRRALRANGDVPVILLFARDDPRAQAQALEAGAADCLVSAQATPSLLQRSVRCALRLASLRHALARSETRYAIAARISNDGLWEWDVAAGRVQYSPRWKALFGCEEHEIGDRPEEWFDRVHPEDLERLKAEIAALSRNHTHRLVSEHRARHSDGSFRWMRCCALSTRDAAGNVTRLVGSLTDITDRKVAEEQLRRSAFYDGLTGLPNRVVFTDRLGRSVERAKRRGDYLFAVLFLDLDRFKLVNDSLGHLSGDQLLISVARRLQTCVRSADTVARLGGDEFAILLDEIRGISDALRVAERIEKEIGMPFNLLGQEIFITASIGIAISASGYANPEALLRDADTAMYRAKTQGRARHAIFDEGMHRQAADRLRLESDLRRALERREFRLHYQPIISLHSGRITGFEALVRWQHPERGLVSPADFIPVAEETGLIVPIDHWVIGEACRQMHQWHARFPRDPALTISVNISAKRLAQPRFVDEVRQVLRDTGIDPCCLRQEITESEIMQNIALVAETLEALRDLHVQLHMDDFGTGYSSLSYLSRLHIDSLKIDGSFVSNMDTGGENFEIVRTIVSLAHNLGKDVIAEGVETEKQFGQLKTLQCEYAQGYYFSKPVDPDAVEALLAADPAW